jgi:hypothetical protein
MAVVYSFLLQDWITCRGDNGAIPGILITQSASEWLDLADYQDVVFYTDVREVGGGVTVSISYQTSPSLEDGSFAAILPPIALTASSTARVDRAFAAFNPTPLARFLRWQLSATGGAVWDATFRVWIAAYGPGA